jgi:hypothetical protein
MLCESPCKGNNSVKACLKGSDVKKKQPAWVFCLGRLEYFSALANPD